MSMSPRSGAIPLSRRRCIACVATVAYVLSGLSIVIVNKMVMRDNGLHAPALVSSTGVLFTAAFTRMLVFTGHVQVRPAGPRLWEFALCRALPVGVLAAGSLCFGNMSYIYLDAGFVQMLRAGTPALLLFVLSVLRIEQVSTPTACLALMMVLGSSLASLQQPNATFIGLVVQFASQLCEVLQCAAMQQFLQKLGFEAWDAGYYLSPAIAACCLLTSLVLEWPHIIASHKVGLLFQQVPLLILSGTIGIVVNFSGMFLVKFTSSLFSKLLGIARSACLVLIFIANGEDFTWSQVVGYMICLSAFIGSCIVKNREMEQQHLAEMAAEESSRENELRDSDVDTETPASPTATVKEGLPAWDLTSAMFWFAVCTVFAGIYQAAVVGDLPSCGIFERELTAARHRSVSSVGVPPTPYLEPITAGTRSLDWSVVDDDDEDGADERMHGGKFHTAGALSVESPAKVIYLKDGRFLLHSKKTGGLYLARRTPETVLSSSWVITSKQFGTVYLSSLDNKGSVTWLSCAMHLTPDWSEACLLWMTAASWDSWSSKGGEGEYVLRKGGDEDLFLAADGDGIVWSHTPTALLVDDWAPEACPLRGMTPSPHRYEDAVGEVTFTMTTFFHVYARSIMFRQALSSVFTHLKEREVYVKEFLVINDWYEGRSLAFNGTFTGPDVQQTRREMLDFFPGCVGVGTAEAKSRPANQRCTFVFKGASEKGQPKALNILLDLMTTKFWIHFEDDRVFYRDVYVSRLLAPMYDHPNSCWQRSQASVAAISDGAHQVNGVGAAGECLKIAGVRLGGKPGLNGIQDSDTFEVQDYNAPAVLRDEEYVRELLAHGGFDDDPKHDWGKYKDVGAVPWPMFSLRPSLHNLTYIKSLEAPLFYGGERGRFCEDRRITAWTRGGKTFNFNWNFELEFAVRWSRGGATLATLSPGACMRDVSNGISSFERSFEYR